ncbi:hypothetical protein FEK33_20635 [Nocardia asteroides NBRC 15531]|uniref:YcaO domain-containing protein n=1 Tax=Nocardia asteroides NBRC 15531 TaxID=1110697 RepID=U5EKM1_NOCAS|nr:hypothetical protein [Nocardia asteroides]TLF65698.1 hypothetical protein FEK33_20635 [Nocardia asteroides NBRC 15531]UGT47533.1 hypothetical protein LT345_23980 [Nocardia asteroides]SFM47891.1 YcaO-like family protein [Nocardia asteroides]VEG33557.1 YcaO-like family [Nocardia asteroides]GAD87800.1 hypothetical protein NCAST_37_01080 [Nocardia asteroides NBRC 15531]
MLSDAEQLFALPFRTIAHTAASDPRVWIASTGISWRSGSNTEARYALGHAASGRRDDSENVSRWECFERLLMNAEVTASRGRLVHGTFRDGRQATSRTFETVVPRPWHVGGQRLFPTGATGLAIHTCADTARNNAVAEVLERHVSESLWYGNLQEPANLLHSDDSSTSVWWPLGDGSVLAWHVAERLDEQVFVVGSAVRSEIAEAVRHAQEEATMLLDAVLSHRRPTYSSEAKTHRYASLRGSASGARRGHFQRLIAGSGRAGAVAEFAEMVSKHIVVYALIEWPELVLVRGVPIGIGAPQPQRDGIPDHPFS